MFTRVFPVGVERAWGSVLYEKCMSLDEPGFFMVMKRLDTLIPELVNIAVRLECDDLHAHLCLWGALTDCDGHNSECAW